MYQVQSIVGKRINPDTNQIQYRVKWFNYPPEDNTWEPERNLKFVKNLINQFNEKKELRGEGLYDDIREGPKDTTKGGKERQRDVSDQEDMKGNLFEEQQSQKQQNNTKKQKQQKRTNKQKQKGKQKQIQKQQDKQKQKVGDKSGEKGQSLSNSRDRQRSKGDRQRNQLKPRQRSENLKPILKQVQIERNRMFTGLTQAQANNNIDRNQIDLKKVPPPLPPDFSLSKKKYFDPPTSQRNNSSYVNSMANKHKFIQKQRSNGPPKRQFQLQPERSQSMKNQQRRIMQGSKTQPSQQGRSQMPQKLVPPPPPPMPHASLAASAPQTPIVQQNYFANQYQLYNPHMPQQQYSNRISNQNIYSNSNTNPRMQTSGYQNPMYQSSMGINSYQYQNYQYGAGNGMHKGYQGGLEVYEVLNMEKTDSGYLFFAGTNKGQIWLTRSQIVPKFSTQLVQFYQKHLTFQD